MFRKLSRYRLRTLLLLTAVVAGGLWWFNVRPRQQEQRRIEQQRLAGQKLIHQRDRVYLDFVFDQTVKDHLVTVLGDSRLTHWDGVLWIVCPDRKTFVSYGADQTLLAWNREDGSIRRGFYDVPASAYASEKKQFLLVTADGKLQTWSLGDQSPQAQPSMPALPNIQRFHCSPNGRFLFYGKKFWKGPFTMWDCDAGKSTLTVKGGCCEVAFSPDSQRVLVADGNKIDEYEASSGKRLATITTSKSKDGDIAQIKDIVYSANGERLYVSDAVGRILVFDWEKKQAIRDFGEDGLDTVSHLAVRKDEKTIFAAASHLWRFDQWGRPDRWKTQVELNQRTSALYAGPEGVVACILGGRLVELNGDRTRRLKGGPHVDATCFAFSPDGDRIALAGRDGQIVIRETARWERVQSWRAHRGRVRRLVWSPRGGDLVSFASGMLAVWNPRTGEEVQTAPNARAFSERMGVFDRSGKRLAYYGGAGRAEMTILDAESFQVTSDIPRGSIPMRGEFVFSRDGRRLYIGASRSMVHVWSFASKRSIQNFGPGTRAEVKLALSRDEKVVFAGDSRRVLAFDTASGKQLWAAKVHDRQLFDISVHPTLPLAATSGGDGRVCLLDPQTGRVLKRLRLGPPLGDILQVDFSPDGELLAAAMSNGAVVVMRSPWD